MQQPLFSCNGSWKEPEFDETCRQQNFVGLFANVYYCNEFNSFAHTYVRVAYGLGYSFQGSAKGRTPTELKKVWEIWYEDEREVSGRETLLK